MENFTLGISLKLDGKKYIILRNLDKYFDDNNKFDLDQFYNENYILFEENIDLKKENIIINNKTNKNILILGYINFANIKIFDNFNNFERLLNINLSSELISNIFFIEGGVYNVYDDSGFVIDKIKFSRRIGKFGITKKNIKGFGNIEFVLYPSKAVHNNFVTDILNKVNHVFPGSVIDDKGGSRFIRNNYDKVSDYKILRYLNQLKYIKLFSKRVKKEEKIRKIEFNMIKHNLSKSLENQILSRGGFDEIDDDELITIEKKEVIYDIPENQYLLSILKYYFDSNMISNEKKGNIKSLIDKYDKYGIMAKLTADVPQKLLQHPIYSLIVKEYLYDKNNLTKSRKTFQYNLGTFNNEILGEDPIKSFTELYEIYCFIEYKNFLSRLNVEFIDNLEDKLYDGEKQEILKYENTFNRGVIRGNYKNQMVKLYFGDKLFIKNQRNYSLFGENEDLGFIDKKFKKVSKDGITPDITIEILGKLIIGDVKFSSFKDKKTGLEYPNPYYFKEELQKYRRIFINKEIISTPIIIFYPGNIERHNLSKFSLMHQLILKSYNIFLFPINNIENIQLFDFLKVSFLKILSD